MSSLDAKNTKLGKAGRVSAGGGCCSRAAIPTKQTYRLVYRWLSIQQVVVAHPEETDEISQRRFVEGLDDPLAVLRFPQSVASNKLGGRKGGHLKGGH